MMTVKGNMLLATRYVKERNKEEIINSALNALGVLDKINAYKELSEGNSNELLWRGNMVKPYDILLGLMNLQVP